jgi:hypothetical protein
MFSATFFGYIVSIQITRWRGVRNKSPGTRLAFPDRVPPIEAFGPRQNQE